MSERSDRWHSTRRARELALFANKRFEVVREIKGESFKTPLGYSAKNGYEVRNVESGDTFKVGKTTLKVMAEEYSAVTLPAPKKRGRPKKQRFANGGYIEGPGTRESDQIPAVLSIGHVLPAYLTGQYGSEVIGRMNAMSTEDAREATEFAPKIENGNEPGAHPVSEQEPDENDRSGSLAGPTYGNPNSDEHYEG